MGRVFVEAAPRTADAGVAPSAPIKRAFPPPERDATAAGASAPTGLGFELERIRIVPRRPVPGAPGAARSEMDRPAPRALPATDAIGPAIMRKSEPEVGEEGQEDEVDEEQEEREEESIRAQAESGAGGTAEESRPAQEGGAEAEGEKREEEEPIQAKRHPGPAPPPSLPFEAQLRSLSGRGEPLPAAERAFFEPRLGVDLGGVRVHTDLAAAQLARAIDARAFTFGRDVVFGAGQYAPGTLPGRRLIAHELAHVVQQRAAPRAAPGELLLQRQTTAPAATDPNAQTRQKVDDVLRKMRTARGAADVLVPAEWQLLAGNQQLWTASEDAKDTVVAHLRRIKISWETVTEPQRTVFLALGDPRRENLRKEALSNSPLFNTITKLHVYPGVTEQEITAARKSRIGPRPSWWVTRQTTVAKIWSGKEWEKVLFDPVRAVMSTLPRPPRQRDINVALRRFTNRRLAFWVYMNLSRQTAAIEEIQGYNCGILNLFTLAVARGDVDPPSVEKARKWMQKWTLDQDPAKGAPLLFYGKAKGKNRLVDKLLYSPESVLRHLSGLKKVLPSAARQYDKARQFNPSELRELWRRRYPGNPTQLREWERLKPLEVRFLEFQRVVEENIEILRKQRGGLQPTEETRVGLVQGVAPGKHSYIIYKDLDGKWRSMDIYLHSEDLAYQELGQPRALGTQFISGYYFLVEKST